MTDAVLTAITELLRSENINAVREYDAAAAGLDEGLVCVGIESCRLSSPGCGDYLGQLVRGGEVVERYGYRCEMTVLLDVFAPRAGACVECFDAIGAALTELPQGIKYRALVCGETVFDEVTDAFHSSCRLLCEAMLERSSTAQAGVFSDFTLKGVPKYDGEK